MRNLKSETFWYMAIVISVVGAVTWAMAGSSLMRTTVHSICIPESDSDNCDTILDNDTDPGIYFSEDANTYDPWIKYVSSADALQVYTGYSGIEFYTQNTSTIRAEINTTGIACTSLAVDGNFSAGGGTYTGTIETQLIKLQSGQYDIGIVGNPYGTTYTENLMLGDGSDVDFTVTTNIASSPDPEWRWDMSELYYSTNYEAIGTRAWYVAGAQNALSSAVDGSGWGPGEVYPFGYGSYAAQTGFLLTRNVAILGLSWVALDCFGDTGDVVVTYEAICTSTSKLSDTTTIDSTTGKESDYTTVLRSAANTCNAGEFLYAHVEANTSGSTWTCKPPSVTIEVLVLD